MPKLEEYEICADMEQEISIRCVKHGYFDVENGAGPNWPSLRDVHHAIAAHEAAYHPLRAIVNRLEERMQA